MLCEADTKLIEREPRITALRRLLDPEEAVVLARDLYPEATIDGVRPRYVRYKPGTSCLVGWQIETPDGPVDAYARAHDPARVEKLEKVGQNGIAGSPLGEKGVRVLRDEAIAVYVFPNDHELPALRALADDDSRRALLQEALPERSGLWEGTFEPMRYKPERRFVAKLTGAGGQSVVLKFYTAEDYEAVRKKTVRFKDNPPLHIPEQVHQCRPRRVVSSEWWSGRSMREWLCEGALPESACRTVGAALARLHEQGSRKLESRHDGHAYRNSVIEAGRTIGELLPGLGERASAVAAMIVERLETQGWRDEKAIHGDMSADQVLLDGDRAAIVDFDRAGFGDPRVDLGSFHARLIYDVTCGGLAERIASEAWAALRIAYDAETSRGPIDGVACFTAATALQLAVEPFRLRQDAWSASSAELVERAAQLVGDAHGAV